MTVRDLESWLTPCASNIWLNEPFTWNFNELIENFIWCYCFCLRSFFNQRLPSKFFNHCNRTGKSIIIVVHESCSSSESFLAFRYIERCEVPRLSWIFNCGPYKGFVASFFNVQGKFPIFGGSLLGYHLPL